MPEVAVYITYEDIFGRSPDQEFLAARLQDLSLHDCLQSVGKLSFLLAQDEHETADRFIADRLGNGMAVLMAQAMLRVGRRIVFDRRLLGTARLALFHAQRRDPDSFAGNISAFAHVILGVADALDADGELPEGDPQSEEVVDWFAGFRLRRVGLPRRILRNTVPRAVRLFIDLPLAHPDLVSGETPAARFEEQVGMSLERYLAIAFAVGARFFGWDRDPAKWVLGPAYFENTNIRPDEMRRAMRVISATPDELVRAFEDENDAGHTSLDDTRPFLVHPFVEIEDDAYLPVDIEALGDGLVGDGIYWRIKPPPAANPALKQAFGDTLGRLLEEHCFEIARSVYPEDQQPRRLFTEFRYGEHGATPDLIVTDERASAFIEIGIDRPNLRDTVGRGDLQAFDHDVESILIPRAEQLDRKITHALAGELPLADVPPQTLELIYPVICLLDGFPIGFPLTERVRTRISSAGYLLQQELAPVTIVSVEDLEHLLGLVEGGAQLTDILAAFHTSSLRDEPLRDFLTSDPALQPRLPTVLEAAFDEIGERLKLQLSPE